MKKFVLGLAMAGAAIAAAPAQSAVVLSSTPGAAVYAGSGFDDPIMFDFETSTPRWNRSIFTTTVETRARPLGSTGGFVSVGPADGTPGVFDLTGLGPINAVSLLWGSIDVYNTLEVLGEGGVVLATIEGSNVWDPANGNQTEADTNRIVRLDFTNGFQSQVTALRFSAYGNAFEVDNIAIAAVPEPATWAMMIGGFGMIGAAARRVRKVRAVYA
jgi:hypothetical protein